jgi:hypothetical protein
LDETGGAGASRAYRPTPTAYRGGYGPASPSKREGEEPSHQAAWRLLSFFEYPANVRTALLAGAQKDGQYHRFEGYYNANRLIGRYDADEPTPTALVTSNEAQLEAAVELVSTAVRQARSFFEASLTTSNSVRPVLLFYGCLNLTKALVASTFANHPAVLRGGHGLSFNTDDQNLQTYPLGEFPAFHDSVCSGRDVYLPGRTFNLDVLFAADPELFEALSRVRGKPPGGMTPTLIDDVQVKITDVNGADVWTHVMAVELMAVFALSCWSRYKPVEWEHKLRGETTGDAYIYGALMEYISHDFPTRTFSLLSGRHHFFGPAKMSERDFRKRFEAETARQLRGF